MLGLTLLVQRLITVTDALAELQGSLFNRVLLDRRSDPLRSFASGLASCWEWRIPEAMADALVDAAELELVGLLFPPRDHAEACAVVRARLPILAKLHRAVSGQSSNARRLELTPWPRGFDRAGPKRDAYVLLREYQRQVLEALASGEALAGSTPGPELDALGDRIKGINTTLAEKAGAERELEQLLAQRPLDPEECEAFLKEVVAPVLERAHPEKRICKLGGCWKLYALTAAETGYCSTEHKVRAEKRRARGRGEEEARARRERDQAAERKEKERQRRDVVKAARGELEKLRLRQPGAPFTTEAAGWAVAVLGEHDLEHGPCHCTEAMALRRAMLEWHTRGCCKANPCGEASKLRRKVDSDAHHQLQRREG